MTFPIHDATPARHTGPLPSETDVAVIGGGVIGVTAALSLAQRGLRVTLLEKGRIAGEQSSRNWGWVRAQGRDPAELPIMLESRRLWAALSRRLGPALGYRQCGVLYLANTEADLAAHDAWLPHARTHGLDTRALSRAEVAAMLGTAATWKGALYTASDARAEPWAAVPLLADLAAASGVTIRESCAVRALDIAAGRVAGVITEAGRLRAPRVVLAAGAWSRLFLARHGLRLPQLSVLASVAETGPMPEIFPGNAVDTHFAFRRREDGGYSLAPGAEHDFFLGPDAFRSVAAFLPTLRRDFRSTHFRPAAPRGFPDAWSTPRRWDEDRQSPFERCRILNPAPNRATLSRVQDSFAAAFPALGRPPIRTAWAGMIDTLPDVVPVIDHAPIPGLTLATGLSGHGFGIGPGVGEVVARLVTNEGPGHDLTRFRFARFSDGTRVAPGPSL